MIFGLMVMKDEEFRYLDACLKWNSAFVDEMFVYDDRSTDNSVEIAERYGTVAVRVSGDASFMEDEGQFRQDAWHSFEATMKPSPGDWVFVFDADQFLTTPLSGDPDDVRDVLDRLMTEAVSYNSVDIPFKEIFEVDGLGNPHYRTDGFWDTIHAPHLFAYKEGGEYLQKSMGCGSVPMYVLKTSSKSNSKDLTVLHYGYAVFEDRVDKYDRYSSLDEHGHNPAHIQSILAKPSLAKWYGPHPVLS